MTLSGRMCNKDAVTLHRHVEMKIKYETETCSKYISKYKDECSDLVQLHINNTDQGQNS